MLRLNFSLLRNHKSNSAEHCMQAVVVLVVAAVKVSIMSEVVEKLNQIKHKLTKYSSSNQKDAEKVCLLFT